MSALSSVTMGSGAPPVIPDQLVDNRHVRFGGFASFGWLSDDWGPAGYLGDPTAANLYGIALIQAANEKATQWMNALPKPS